MMELPYPMDALEPHVSKETVEFHYLKHHQGYVTKLNQLTTDQMKELTLEQLIAHPDSQPIFNNAAQVYNHQFYWNSMSPQGGGYPVGPIADEIEKQFGSFESFKTAFKAEAMNHFGSGWVWLVDDASNGTLKIISTHDANTPITSGLAPLLTCDVWEHAYYIDYRNLRASYLDSWWHLVNWQFANDNLAQSRPSHHDL
uniref:Superoxide dismutase n=1 Tax=Arcella intermedia TaxID=1963864 RepID=A0A6B2LIW1_9EUKA